MRTEKYIGMTFIKWCQLDRDDERNINLTNYCLTSEDQINGLAKSQIANRTIKKIEFKDNEWYVELNL